MMKANTRQYTGLKRLRLSSARISVELFRSHMRRASSNENKMSDGGRGRPSLGVEGWKSSQKLIVQRSAVRSIAWLGLGVSMSPYVESRLQDKKHQCAKRDANGPVRLYVELALVHFCLL